MKILHINCNYMDSWLHQNMIETLDRLEVESKVFVPLYQLNGHIVKPNANVNPAVCFRKWDRIAYGYKQNKIIKRIKADYNVTEFSCLHAYTLFTDGNVARSLYKEFNIPYVVAVRNTDVNDFFKRMIHLRSTGIKVMKDAKAIFFLSKAYYEKVINTYVPREIREEIIRKSHIVPNGIDDFWHDNINEEKNNLQHKFEEKKIRLIYAGGIDKNKNIGLTCKAKQYLENQGYDLSFCVIGKIKDKSVYEEIKSSVEYHKPKAKEELINFYRSADVFVMPSHTETFGLVYAEAMTQGLPVLYTKGQGFDGQFDDGLVGFSISDTDYTDVARKIVACIGDYDRLRNNCIQKVSKFKWDVICKEYVECYKKVVENIVD